MKLIELDNNSNLIENKIAPTYQLGKETKKINRNQWNRKLELWRSTASQMLKK
jgi:hypothetical protein